jgi:hypothetical protein
VTDVTVIHVRDQFCNNPVLDPATAVNLGNTARTAI